MIRQATQEEKEYYETKLYPLMDKVLAIMDSDKFYLTGGTCLARYYYNHRYSDDLDFFFLGEHFSKDDFENEFVRLANKIGHTFLSQTTVNADYFKRIMLNEGGTTLKLEFIYESFRHIGELKKIDNYLIDCKENVVVNKLTAVHDRKANKDFFDLMFLLKEFDLTEMSKLTELKMVPLDYEGTLMAITGEQVAGTVLVSETFDGEKYNEFVKNLKKRILENAKNSKRLF